MTAILPPPPRYRLTKTLTPEWWWLGRIAVVSVLGALSIVGGMLFPQARVAEAQGIHSGYTYTQRTCQELGQQPRQYQVRDEIDGSDWRSDGGWAIVLIRGVNTAPTLYTIYGVNLAGGGANPTIALRQLNDRFGTINNNHGLPQRHYIAGINGVSGWVTGWSNFVVIDRDKDRQRTTADTFYNGATYEYYEGRFRLERAAYDYSTAYIRWANMLWCR